MKNIIRILIMVLLASATLSSCFKEYLEPVPATAISDLTAFDTKDRIVAQVNGLYAAVKSGQYLGGRYQVYNSIRGDDFLNLQSNGVTGYETWRHNTAPNTNEVQNLWGQVYFAINRINVFLEGLEASRANPATASVLTQAEYDQFRGESLALRGMAYFHLSQLYARPFNQDPNALGMVLRLKAMKDDSENDLARSTVAETYTQILKDLNDAEPLLPPSHSAGTANSVVNVSRMHRNTVIALKSRVYLHMNNYSAVLTEGNKIVPANAPFVAGNGGVAFELASTFESIFRAPYTTPESIFSIPMTDTELPGTQNQLGYYFKTGSGGNNEYAINQESPVWTNLTDFPATDARRLLTETANVSGANHVFLTKYMAFPHTDYAPVIRFAEVLLNVAEAEARQNGVNDRAIALLNAVYLRSNPDATPLGGFANVEAFVDRVMMERNIEFLGEGIRNMDTMRKVAPHGAKANVPAVLPSAPTYVWPIPQNELNTNNAIIQN
ncbi:MAG: RagB/SusD family nutrient uptake outer membrane protein [Bacteroidales bacterium]|nr:RagB/SusD family nutrient uptake outer membrane protein [Bacteroidales bacterium]